MGTERYGSGIGVAVLALLATSLAGCSKLYSSNYTCPSTTHITIPISTNPYPPENSATLVCTTDTIMWTSTTDFTIEFENKDCFDTISYSSTNFQTTPTANPKNPGSGFFNTGIGQCKYTIKVNGQIKSDPHIIVMR